MPQMRSSAACPSFLRRYNPQREKSDRRSTVRANPWRSWNSQILSRTCRAGDTLSAILLDLYSCGHWIYRGHHLSRDVRCVFRRKVRLRPSTQHRFRFRQIHKRIFFWSRTIENCSTIIGFLTVSTTPPLHTIVRRRPLNRRGRRSGWRLRQEALRSIRLIKMPTF